MKLISLFSGIDGFALAAEEVGWEVLASCEINQFPRYVIEDRWTNAYHHGDIHTLNFETLDAELSKRFGNWRTNDIVLSGGFPCQPYSNAGKRLGKDDDRHLWPEYLRIIREIKPRVVVGENVPGLINWNGGMVFEEIQADLEAEGYEVTPFILPACGVNAPHRRDRIWFVAYSSGVGSGKLRNESEKKGSCDSDELSGSEHRVQGDEWASSDSESIRHGRRSSDQCPDGERELVPGESTRGPIGSEIEGCGGERITSNSEIERMERSGPDWEQEPRAHGEEGLSLRGSSGKNWDFWPIEPPIRARNDGFSSESLRQRIREDSMGLLSEEEIDKIFSEANGKWKKETIKAAGNAVVPQVVVQIFRAIDKFLELYG